MKLHRYVEQQRLHITTKDRHSYLSSSWVICPWLIWKMFLTCSSFTIWNIWMKLHRYVDHQRLHIVTKDVISLSISVLLLFRHYISHKITFGAPSSGGVLCSACGAFIIWFFTSHQQSFSYKGTDLPGLLTSTKLGLMCLAQGHNALMPVRLEPAAPGSRVKQSTIEPLRSHFSACWA